MASSPIVRFSPILTVTDMSRSIGFYELLGFAAERYQGGDSYAFLTRGGLEIHLAQSDMLIKGQNPGNGVYFYLQGGTAAALEAEFRARGAAILSPLKVREWKMNEFVLADPDANLLRFGEHA